MSDLTVLLAETVKIRLLYIFHINTKILHDISQIYLLILTQMLFKTKQNVINESTFRCYAVYQTNSLLGKWPSRVYHKFLIYIT